MYAEGGFPLPPMLNDPMSDRPEPDRTPARVLIADDHAPTRSGCASRSKRAASRSAGGG